MAHYYIHAVMGVKFDFQFMRRERETRELRKYIRTCTRAGDDTASLNYELLSLIRYSPADTPLYVGVAGQEFTNSYYLHTRTHK